MKERCYVRKKLSYVVTARGGSGRVEVFVFHESESMRRTLQGKKDNPGDLLKRYDAFLRSNIRAQYWLAKVMEDYWACFEKNLVDFTFITFK